ncbi:MAG: hypothetical protein JWP89_2674 [Schlesneria sp.]|nr:hypothetical protein [Schlesneria sp.]
MKTANKETPSEHIDQATGNKITYRETQKWIPISERGGPAMDSCTASAVAVQRMLDELDAQINTLRGRRAHLETAHLTLLIAARGD